MIRLCRRHNWNIETQKEVTPSWYVTLTSVFVLLITQLLILCGACSKLTSMHFHIFLTIYKVLWLLLGAIGRILWYFKNVGHLYLSWEHNTYFHQYCHPSALSQLWKSCFHDKANKTNVSIFYFGLLGILSTLVAIVVILKKCRKEVTQRTLQEMTALD